LNLVTGGVVFAFRTLFKAVGTFNAVVALALLAFAVAAIWVALIGAASKVSSLHRRLGLNGPVLATVLVLLGVLRAVSDGVYLRERMSAWDKRADELAL